MTAIEENVAPDLPKWMNVGQEGSHFNVTILCVLPPVDLSCHYSFSVFCKSLQKNTNVRQRCQLSVKAEVSVCKAPTVDDPNKMFPSFVKMSILK